MRGYLGTTGWLVHPDQRAYGKVSSNSFLDESARMSASPVGQQVLLRSTFTRHEGDIPRDRDDDKLRWHEGMTIRRTTRRDDDMAA